MPVDGHGRRSSCGSQNGSRISFIRRQTVRHFIFPLPRRVRVHIFLRSYRVPRSTTGNLGVKDPGSRRPSPRFQASFWSREVCGCLPSPPTWWCHPKGSFAQFLTSLERSSEKSCPASTWRTRYCSCQYGMSHMD